jgi:hypothetical protein
MSEREVRKDDNNPPEKLAENLSPASELPVIVKQDVLDLRTKVEENLKVYSRVPDVLVNDDQYERVTTLVTILKNVGEETDKKKTDYKRPYLDATQYLDAAFRLEVESDSGEGAAEGSKKKAKPRSLRKEIDAAIEALKKKLSDFDTRKYEEEQKRLAAERELLVEQAAKDGITIETSEIKVGMASTVKSSHGGSSIRNIVKEWEVIDIDLVPRSLLMIDPAKVQEMIDGGAKEIPGIKISTKVDTHVRRR